MYATREFYIKNESNSELKFLCFNEKECYSINHDIIEIKDKKFVGFGNYHYFDLSKYKYDKNTNTYSVDVLVDRDPFTDLDVCNRSPYDEGNITHLIFSLKYNPLTKKLQATYKGFVSSKDILQYENGKPAKIQVSYIDVYYDNNPKYIKDLPNWLKFFNKEIAKIHAKSIYDIEIEYIIPYYIR